MDEGIIRIDHGSNVYVVRSCYHEDGHDLVAFGGEHSVEVYQIVSEIPCFSTPYHSTLIIPESNICPASSFIPYRNKSDRLGLVTLHTLPQQ